jgi:hypothetical protein
MGWKRIEIRPNLHRYCKDVTDSDAWVRIGEDVDPSSYRAWSPWCNLTDAREVLKRLVEILASEQEGPEPPAWTIVCYKWGAAMRHLVSVGAVSAYHDDGPHEGPAICLLARKVMEGNHAQVK